MKVISTKTCFCALVAAGVLTFGLSQIAKAETYAGTLYIAGMGGHFAKADVVIDPSAVTPINLKTLDKVDIGDGTSHPTHDARIDAKNRDLMFWSTYKIDPATGGPHVGSTDLKTGIPCQALAKPS